MVNMSGMSGNSGVVVTPSPFQKQAIHIIRSSYSFFKDFQLSSLLGGFALVSPPLEEYIFQQ